MNLEQAMALIARLLSNAQGTLQDHQNIQMALSVINGALGLKQNMVPEPNKATKEKIAAKEKIAKAK